MPNWCYNTMTFNKDIKHAIINSEDEVSFDLVVPEPKELLEDTAPGSKHLQSKYGTDSWYDWRLSNWGCKWDASSSSDVTEDGDECSVQFNTPWGSPEAWFSALVDAYPDSYFEMRSIDECYEGATTLTTDGEGGFTELYTEDICKNCGEMLGKGLIMKTDDDCEYKACDHDCLDSIKEWALDDEDVKEVSVKDYEGGFN